MGELSSNARRPGVLDEVVGQVSERAFPSFVGSTLVRFGLTILVGIRCPSPCRRKRNRYRLTRYRLGQVPAFAHRFLSNYRLWLQLADIPKRRRGRAATI